jgi:ATP-binding cassette subfamily B protein
MAQSGADYAEQLDYAAKGRAKSRSLKPLRGLWPFIRPYRGTLAAAIVAMLVAAAATLVLPLAVKGLIDHGFSNAVAVRISQYFFAFVAVAAVVGVASATRYYFVTWLGERVIADLRKAVFDNVISLSPSFFEVTRTGEVLSRLTADTTLIQTVVGSSASVAARTTLTLIGGLVMMFVTSLKLSTLVIGAVVLVMAPLILFGRWVRKLSRKSQDKVADTSAHASETINAVQTVQAFTHEAYERAHFGATVEESFVIAILRTRARAVMTGVVFFAAIASIVCIAWVGAQDMIAGRLTGGLLVQFIIYAIFVAGGVGALSETWGDIQRAAGASERLMELLHAKPEIAAPARPKRLPAATKGALSLEKVVLRYPSRPDHAALDGFSLAITPGEAVALVGPSGAGKSSVFQVLLRFYPIQEGHIRFDGVDTAELDPVELRRHIALVAQDPVIFSGSLADNIRYGRPEASEDEVRRAAEAAAADEFIAKLPNGLDTLVGERGITLSGGQRQRIAIARALLRDAPLLLLDEATSSLDAENERLVQQGLANLMAGRTTIVIAHRLATIQRLKRIVVMDDGRVVGEGSHAELVARGGLYARLANLQFSEAKALVGLR